MLREIVQPKEKKVEFEEVIYDLIFVYIIGRNNQLLHSFAKGFVAPDAFLGYVMTTLAVIQIWNYSTYYFNLFGRHSVRDHVFLLVNMFLLYFIGKGTRSDWQAYFMQYHIAWALILVNIALQYLLEMKNHRGENTARRHMALMAAIMLAEAVIVAADIPMFRRFGNYWTSLAAVLFGTGMVGVFGPRSGAEELDFPHLSERAMLYVVFTFGEMIIAIAPYFEGEISLRSLYFALMAFLIAVGLCLSYEIFYEQIIDREKKTNGIGYMLIHIFLIFALNNITNGLEFMRMEEISILPKILFLTGSLILYFVCLFALGGRHAKAACGGYGALVLRASALGAVFVLAMLLLREAMTVNILISVVFVFAVFWMIYRYVKRPVW